MLRGRRFAIERGQIITALIALLFFLSTTLTSWARWASFAYRTFDLAYYVQAVWQLIHGRFQVSVQYVPLLGNHVEPIVFLFAPLFFVFRHAMLFVVVQNAALAAMGPVAYKIARRVGLAETRACLLAAALLATPAAGYVALHEFHPEALTAPIILWMLHARLARSLTQYWVAFLAALACKENMALLLAAYCGVHCILERKESWPELRRWILWPMAIAIMWFVICNKVITPTFNSGNIDYLALYDRLGASGSEIVRNAFTKPQLALAALSHSLGGGNLVWALLLPFFCLPILRPRWLVIAVPLLLQHLLSWRASEWSIFFHYGAPLLPLFWIATAEAIVWLGASRRVPGSLARAVPALVLIACIAAQVALGPALGVAGTWREWFAGRAERARKTTFVSAIPSNASVVAPLPYLSHLAMREELHSLHYILKGLKTLSRSRFQPPSPTDFVLIDYGDLATFDPVSGYYHPRMRALDGKIIPGSDELLHEFLRAARWESRSCNELTLLTRSEGNDARNSIPQDVMLDLGAGTKLLAITKSTDFISAGQPLEIRMVWKFERARQVFPWMLLRLASGNNPAIVFNRGLCAPEAGEGIQTESWQIAPSAPFPAGDYKLEALFVDRTKAAWLLQTGNGQDPVTLLAPPVSLGALHVTDAVSQD